MASIAAKASARFEIAVADMDRVRVFYGRGQAEW
jgi:hypothetical protein